MNHYEVWRKKSSGEIWGLSVSTSAGPNRYETLDEAIEGLAARIDVKMYRWQIRGHGVVHFEGSQAEAEAFVAERLKPTNVLDEVEQLLKGV